MFRVNCFWMSSGRVSVLQAKPDSQWW
uniref:Uncharacterized protein n=1 Tax=Anguilla anguilla TaxID=7936 RepID=A0A0E9VGA6_ANGAN